MLINRKFVSAMQSTSLHVNFSLIHVNTNQALSH